MKNKSLSDFACELISRERTMDQVLRAGDLTAIEERELEVRRDELRTLINKAIIRIYELTAEKAA